MTERPSQAYEKPPLNENQLLDRDRSLRLFVMDALQRVEVAVRASISNTMSLKAPGGAFWYLDPRNFDGEIRFSDSLSTISRETRRHKQRTQRQAPEHANTLERKRLYPVLVSLQTILYTISPHSTWAKRLHALLHHSAFVPLTALGMTEGWDKDPFWADVIVDAHS
ncbi:Abi family protein [Actinomyces gaoshouyii]|uniref:Uncharacterized protein n=1 Tax=Actinomyces gaoshouyii TaxID=1960083 RepID=A0A8H9LFH3_9ACTO|nr:Abi family protein [Actinomyces gaoshouyii]GGO96035.1 hypothetical protein GCM10011612_05270 [Actinomyces gaoshouyii]